MKLNPPPPHRPPATKRPSPARGPSEQPEAFGSCGAPIPGRLLLRMQNERGLQGKAFVSRLSFREYLPFGGPPRVHAGSARGSSRVRSRRASRRSAEGAAHPVQRQRKRELEKTLPGWLSEANRNALFQANCNYCSSGTPDNDISREGNRVKSFSTPCQGRLRSNTPARPTPRNISQALWPFGLQHTSRLCGSYPAILGCQFRTEARAHWPSPMHASMHASFHTQTHIRSSM